MTTSSTISRSELKRSLDLLEIKPGKRFSIQVLKDLLPTTEAALFFAKVYELDYTQLSNLLHHVCDSEVADALFSGNHSTDLQSYLVGSYAHESWCAIESGDLDEYGDLTCDCTPVFTPGVVNPDVLDGDIVFDPDVPVGEILPQVWESLEITVAQSIKDVASKLEDIVGLLPGKQGTMVFNSMMVMNRKRPTIGDYKASVHHDRQKENLLILDVSGSMTESTVRAIVDDVVALSYMANAHLAIVSNDAFYWAPGTYDSDAVLKKAQFGGTYYEELAPLLNRDWGVVITVADYDSSRSAAEHINRVCSGHIDEVLDISLVNRPTFLAECVGQLADKVTPLLIARSAHVLA
jgi:hypothetical protein